MSRARIYARNLAANWIGHGANLAVMFFMSPFVVHTLGKTQYGIWSLLTVITGYLGLFDLGIRASTGRHITLYLGKGDRDAVDETIRTGLGFYTAAAGLILAVSLLLGWVFPAAFASVPEAYHVWVRVLLPLMAVNVWISAVRVILASVLHAHERFDLSRGMDLGVLAVRTAGTVVALTMGYGIEGLVVVVLGANLVGLAGTWGLARRTHEGLRLWPLLLDKARLRELVGYGVAAFVSAIAMRIIGQTDLIVVGAAIDVAEVTTYSVGAMLVFYAGTFIRQITGVFFPPVQKAVAKGEMGDASWLYHRQVRLAMIVGIPMFVGFITFGEAFIRLWMKGPEFPEPSVRVAALVMAVLSASKLAYLLSVGSSEVLAAMGHVRATAILAAAEALANLGLSVVFVLGFRAGLPGIAAGTLVACVLVRAGLSPWYACRKIRRSFAKLLLHVGGPAVLTGAGFAAWCLVIRHWLGAESWGLFWLSVALALAGYVPVAFSLLVQSQDRRRFLQALRLVRLAEN